MSNPSVPSGLKQTFHFVLNVTTVQAIKTNSARMVNLQLVCTDRALVELYPFSISSRPDWKPAIAFTKSPGPIEIRATPVAAISLVVRKPGRKAWMTLTMPPKPLANASTSALEIPRPPPPPHCQKLVVTILSFSYFIELSRSRNSLINTVSYDLPQRRNYAKYEPTKTVVAPAAR